jgi:hypothetical protein
MPEPWPLVCESCGTEKYIGTLFGGLCADCHDEAVDRRLRQKHSNTTGQSALGDFA